MNRARFILVRSLVVLAFVAGLGSSLSGARELTIEDRVSAQLAIEQVYWSHRVWPKENPRPKPPLSTVMTGETIRAKVEDYLKKSNALEAIWQRPITAVQLQAELDRMIAQTRDSRVLHELFAALGNDPFLIAETLARQILADRLIRHWFAFDDRFHSDVDAKARAALAACDNGGCMKTMGGTYRETAWRLRSDGPDASPGGPDAAVRLDGIEWERHLARLATKVGGTAQALPLMTVSALEETADAFVVTAVLAAGKREVTTATTEWKKRSFDAWWVGASPTRDMRINAASAEFALGALALGGCTPDTWNETLYDVPDPRSDHSAVWTGTEMILWGGAFGPGYLQSGSRYNPATDTWVPTSTGANVPSARRNHTAIWTGTEMIVWGGSSDTTGGRYDPASDKWVATSTGANVPEARYAHTAVWTGTEMIVWGGLSIPGPSLNTGGRYNPASDSWVATSIGQGVPSARNEHTAVWTGTKMIVWGGYPTTNRGSRYDPGTDSWDATSNGANLPEARRAHTAVWTGTEMIVWGGYTPTNALNTGGRYNPATNKWGGTSTGANVPSGRGAHTAVWTGVEMIVWGGLSGSAENTGGRFNPASDTWVATSVGSNVPAGRFLHTALWTGTEMIVWGGGDIVSSSFYTGGRYNPATATWAATSTGANVPSPRYIHSAVWTGTEMIVWGGFTGTYVDTGSRYDPATDTWVATSTGSNVPAPRYAHTATWTGTEMIVWGGYMESYLNTGSRYDPTADKWTPTSTELNVPASRYGHSAVWTGRELIVWGGYPGGAMLNSGGRYDPVTDTWAPTSTGSNVAAPRYNHSGVWTGRQMIVWGGHSGSMPLNTGGRYDPATNTWAPTSTGVDVPDARSVHTAIWTGTELVVWGGASGVNSPVATGGRYNPATDTWIATSTGANVPSPRYDQTAVWTGSEMIAWGGEPPTATGGLYCVASCAAPTLWYQDQDDDGYGIATVSLSACTHPTGYAATDGDCDDANPLVHPAMAPPSALGGVQVRLVAGSLEVSWDGVAEATSYDVVRGGLDELRTMQELGSSVEGCVADELGDLSIEDPSAASASSVWYLVRAGNCGGGGTYSSETTSERPGRDSGIAASPAACP